MRCPSIDLLAQYVVGQLTATEQCEITAHLDSSCPRCFKLVDWCRKVSTLLPGDHLTAPSTDLFSRSLALFKQSKYFRAERRDAQPTVLFAQLVYDSRAACARVGARSEQVTAERRLLYHADLNPWPERVRRQQVSGFDLDLAIRAQTRAHANILGQLLFVNHSCGQQELTVELWRDGESVQSTAIDEYGEFAFEGVPHGSYNMHIDNLDWMVVIELPIVE